MIHDPALKKAHITRKVFCGNDFEEAGELWRAERVKGIGASDVAVALEYSGLKSSYHLWMEKTGKYNEDINNRYTHWGRIHEPSVAEEYRHALLENCPKAKVVRPLDLVSKDIRGGNLTTLKKNNSLQIVKTDGLRVRPTNAYHAWYENSKFPLAFASPDRLVHDPDSGKTWGLEIKTAGTLTGWRPPSDLPLTADRYHDDPEQVPVSYYLQCVWSMMVLELDRWDLAVLISGNTYRHYTFKRDEEKEKEIWEAAKEWWDLHVVGDVTPNLRGHQDDDDMLLIRYPQRADAKEYIQADSEGDKLLRELVKYTTQLEQAKHRLHTLRQHIKAIVQDKHGMESDHCKVDWIRYEKPSIQWKMIALTLAEEYTGEPSVPREMLERYTTRSTNEQFRLKVKQLEEVEVTEDQNDPLAVEAASSSEDE